MNQVLVVSKHHLLSMLLNWYNNLLLKFYIQVTSLTTITFNASVFKEVGYCVNVLLRLHK